MEYLYMLSCDGAEWEDIILFTDKEEAIQASIKYYKCRVEIFKKAVIGYTPTFTFYKNGKLCSS